MRYLRLKIIIIIEKFLKQIYDKIIEADPTSNINHCGMYVNWLLNLYLSYDNETDKNNFINKLNKISICLSFFNKYCKELAKYRIKDYKNYEELINAMEPFIIQFRDKEQKRLAKISDVKNIKEEQSNIVYTDDEWLVIVPLTQKSCCFWGQNSQWCTASNIDDDNMFDFYNNMGPLYIILAKNQHDIYMRQIKYQFHFEDAQFHNMWDEHITEDEYDTFSEGLKKFLRSKLITINALLNWAFLVGDKELIKPKIFNSNDIESLYNWAINTKLSYKDEYSPDIEEVKEMLLKSKDSKVNYYKMKWNQNFEINKI